MPSRSKSTAQSADPIDREIGAFINGVHAGQILLHETGARKGDPVLFSRGKSSLEEMIRLATAFQELLAAPQEGEKGWIDFQRPPFDRQSNIAFLNTRALATSPRLPVNVVLAYLKKRLGGRDLQSVRAIANLCQF